jgi:hypothetical protein
LINTNLISSPAAIREVLSKIMRRRGLPIRDEIVFVHSLKICLGTIVFCVLFKTPEFH